jgi:hypothetical protein
MSKTARYFAFYDGTYGNENFRQEFDKIEDVLALVKKITDEDFLRRQVLIVIEGHKLEFEPHTVVETFRVKEPKP